MSKSKKYWKSMAKSLEEDLGRRDLFDYVDHRNEELKAAVINLSNRVSYLESLVVERDA